MDKREEAIMAVLQGVPVDTMAAELDVGKATIYRWLREGGHSKQARRIRHQEIIDDYLDESNQVHDILEKYGMSTQTLYSILHDRNIPLRRAGRNEDRDQLAVDLYEAGVTMREIRAATGYANETLYDIYKERNIRLRRYSVRRGE